ncbi:DUF4280 domain-containing protein [Flavobacterium pectinovorum]|uniref:DUF4280 domain-containing protein n=1 Tax=Flavobacterium pectinovorum TaxID=29533 RepID=UPI00265FFFA7|nr:DUF4280 domain-containing protein [Flavobacterium pectinovorum]WKL47767.1 DUF4280 domain-containing protein [Flavobacterium pectinovorum]
MAKPDNTLKRKEREEKEEAEDGLKFVIDGAKLKCDLCTVPEGDLKVNFDTPTIQDKKVATVVEKDKKSLIFKGNCKKSPNSSSPCASVMKLADWKDVGTVYFQDQFPLLLKSTIKCEYGGVEIKITDCAQRNEIENLDITGAPVPGLLPDFNIKFELDKTEKTIVPFGILDFENKRENPFFSFKYVLSKSKIDSLNFQIMDEDDTVIYQMTHLETVIVKASKKPEILFEAKKPTEGPLISKTWDYQELYKQHGLFNPDDYTQVGEYYIHWDGFDNDDIYDSTRFNGKDLKAKITAIKDGLQKSIVVDFSTKYSQVDWTDVKIDKKSKRIDVTLRVNLIDGGAEGLSCWNNTRNFNPPHTKSEICDWDKIPESEINPSYPVIKTRTQSFSDLEKLAIEGLQYHWGRNKNHFATKNITINSEHYEIYLSPMNTENNAIKAVKLIYNTNGEWMRSGNPGSIKDPMTAVGNLVSRQAICYNVGYIKYSENWGYSYDNSEIEEFKFTSAHEIGHEILKKYGGTFYSYGHKGSVNSVTQSMKKHAPPYPKNGEIDIMPYYPVSPPLSLYNRYEAAENDVLGLIWLTKINIT